MRSVLHKKAPGRNLPGASKIVRTTVRFLLYVFEIGKRSQAMTLTPEMKRKMENEIAKFLRHLTTEQKAQIDVIDIKRFNLNRHPQTASASPR